MPAADNGWMTFTNLRSAEPILDPRPLRTVDRDLRAMMRDVATRPPSTLPVTSAYIDLRPDAPGPNPVVRSGPVRLRDGMRAALEAARGESTVHSPEYESLARDQERLTAAVERVDPSVRGLVAFSRGGDDLFEVARLGVPVTDDVQTGPLPHLLQIAGIVDRARGLVALADTNTLHLFRARHGGLYELGAKGIDDDPDDYMLVKSLERARFEDHVREHRKAFARAAAQSIAEELQRGRDELLLLAGPQEATSLLREELPKAARDSLVGHVHVELRLTYDELVDAVLPPLEEAHRAQVIQRAETAVGEAKANDMGVAGEQDVRRLIELGAVMELFVDGDLEREHQLDGGPSVDWVDDLIGRAAATDAATRFVTGHQGLTDAGRVAALLRFRV